MNCQLQHLWVLITNWYAKLELHFLTIWVIALAVWPDYVLSILQSFLANDMNFSTTSAAAIVNAQNGSTALFGIVGAVVLDGYLTHYGMIFLSSLFYSAVSSSKHTFGLLMRLDINLQLVCLQLVL